MAYEKQTWENGVSPVNAERMNHIEDGIAQAGVVATFSENPDSSGEFVCEPGTFAKIQNAFFNFQPVMLWFIGFYEGVMYGAMPCAITSFEKDASITFTNITGRVAYILPDDTIDLGK